MEKKDALEILKESDFRRELKASPRTGYLFFGDEDYLKAFAINQARSLLCPDPSLAFFNDMRLHAIDYTPQKLLDAITPMPMMTDRKLITLDGLNVSAMRASEIDELCEVIAELESFDYNLLIVSVSADGLDTGYLPRRPSSTLLKLAEVLTPVQFDRCTTAKLTAWIEKHFAHNGVRVSPALCAQLTQYCGHSMFILANEIDKLSYYVLANGRDEPTAEDLRLVCCPVSEYDTYALANAIMESNAEAALAILADYRQRRVDPIFILGDVTRSICEMVSVQAMTADGASPAEIGSILSVAAFKVGLYQKSLRNTSEKRLRRALDSCIAADAALKSSPTGYAVLERLICSL